MLDRQRTSSIGAWQYWQHNLEANGTKFCALRDTSTKEDVVGKITIISNTLLSMVKKVTDPRNNISVDTHSNDLIN